MAKLFVTRSRNNISDLLPTINKNKEAFLVWTSIFMN